MALPAESSTRRGVLAAVGAATAGTLSGCTDRLWMAAEQSPLEQVSLTIKTLPFDDDPIAVRIASQLAANLREAGIEAGHEPMDEPDLYREVLIHGDYDVFVARHDGYDDPDALRSLLHSDFVNEQGWQNPFYFADETVDELLETQSTADGDERNAVLADLFDTLGLAAPFTTVAFPHHIGGAATELEVSTPPRGALDYLEIARNGSSRVDGEWTLRVGVVDPTFTERLNPIAVDLGDVSTPLGLVYDPLVRHASSGYVAWLAESVEWDDRPRSLEATVTLREGVTWHDGEPLRADDVAFTVELLKDTSLGEAENPIPAPRYRGRSTLIEDATAVDARRVRFDFGERAKEVARRALTIPLLPEHIWEPKAEPVNNFLTEALNWDNEEPIGSGLYAFAGSESRERLELEPHEPHVLRSPSFREPAGPDAFREVDAAARIEFSVAPNVGAAVNELVEEELDLVATSIPPAELGPIDEASHTSVVTTETRSFYVVGYNVRRSELSNPRFRRVVSRLVDRAYVVENEEFFDGYATEATSIAERFGLAPGEWTPPQGRGTVDPASARELEFPGSDGEIDTDTVRRLFEDAGYQYEDGDLIA